MATQAAQTVQAPSQLATLQGLLSLLGGGGSGTGTTTTSPGDITALQQLFGQLQGANYQGLLESVFQQAAGQIPRLQAAYGNAVGARSGNNSAAAAALQELLKATTIEAQGQLANQQLQNQQVQANVAGNIANATRGQTSTNKANTMTGSGLGDLAAMFALLKGAQVLTGSKDMNEMFGKATGVKTGGPAPVNAPVETATVTPVTQTGQVTSAAAIPSFAMGTPVGDLFSQPGMGSYDWTGGVAFDPNFANFSDMFASQANELAASTGMDSLDALMQVTGGFGTMPDTSALDQGNYEDWSFLY